MERDEAEVVVVGIFLRSRMKSRKGWSARKMTGLGGGPATVGLEGHQPGRRRRHDRGVLGRIEHPRIVEAGIL
jgi:hypothetical protein